MSGPSPSPGSQEWLDSVIEDVIDPDVPIIDPREEIFDQWTGDIAAIATCPTTASAGTPPNDLRPPMNS
ncbi:MAG TPA: hypothetical protein VES40_20530 [Ilumatobacteraceae bacterium]|nr:hypothetical protein [Ilumatobacteraceae bacterium]